MIFTPECDHSCFILANAATQAIKAIFLCGCLFSQSSSQCIVMKEFFETRKAKTECNFLPDAPSKIAASTSSCWLYCVDVTRGCQLVVLGRWIPLGEVRFIVQSILEDGGRPSIHENEEDLLQQRQRSITELTLRAREMVQRVKVIADKPENPSSSPNSCSLHDWRKEPAPSSCPPTSSWRLNCPHIKR